MIAGPIFNQDCTELFYVTPPEKMKPEVVDGLVDRMAARGVKILLINTNAQKTNYASDVWEPFWAGYDPDGPDNQPVLAKLPPSRIKPTRRMLDSMLALARSGIDYPARAVERCHQRGIQCWISIRMNDLHDVNLPDSPLLSSFWKQHPELRRERERFAGWPDRALDYAHPQVREHYMRLIRETLARFDCDGIELDFMRFPYHFRVGHERDGAEILTAWMRQVREVVRQWEEKRGHKILVGVRVPAVPQAAYQLGLDAHVWAREGLVQLVVVTPFWTTCDFDIPIELWRELLAGTGATLAGGLETRVQPYPGGPARMISPEEARGAAAAILADGADAVYLFNYFESLYTGGSWSRDEYDRTLAAMSSLQALAELPRCHTVTYHDTAAPGQRLEYVLPATGTRLAFRIRTGPKPIRGRVVLRAKVEGLAKADRLEVRVNGYECGRPSVSEREIELPIPLGVMRENLTVVEIQATSPVTVKGISIHIEPS